MSDINVRYNVRYASGWGYSSKYCFVCSCDFHYQAVASRFFVFFGNFLWAEGWKTAKNWALGNLGSALGPGRLGTGLGLRSVGSGLELWFMMNSP